MSAACAYSSTILATSLLLGLPQRRFSASNPPHWSARAWRSVSPLFVVQVRRLPLFVFPPLMQDKEITIHVGRIHTQLAHCILHAVQIEAAAGVWHLMSPYPFSAYCNLCGSCVDMRSHGGPVFAPDGFVFPPQGCSFSALLQLFFEPTSTPNPKHTIHVWLVTVSWISHACVRAGDGPADGAGFAVTDVSW